MNTMQYCKEHAIYWNDIKKGSVVYDPGYGMGEEYLVVVESIDEEKFTGVLYYLGEEKRVAKETFSKRDIDRFTGRGDAIVDISSDHDFIQRSVIKQIIEEWGE